MKKFNLLLVAAFMSMGMMVVSCGSGSTDEKGADSTETKNIFGDPNATENIPSREKETVSLGGKLKEIPAEANITKESIKNAGNVVFIEVGDKALAETALVSGDLSVTYDGKAEFLFANFDKNAKIMKEFGVTKNEVPVIIVTDTVGNFEKFTGADAKAKAEAKLKANIKK